MKKLIVISIMLSMILCISSIFVPVNAAELSADKAKKLLSKGWENIDENVNEPVIVYLLKFKELNSHIMDVFNYQLEKKEDPEAEENWKFIVDKEKLELIKDFPNSYTVNVGSWQKKQKDKSVYSSYLTTVGNKPIDISMEKDILLAEDEEIEQEELLQINLTPEVIDLDNKKVMTEISMKYKGKSGSVADLNTTSWVGQNSNKPLTVVYQSFDSGKEQKRKYFGLYLTTTVINSEEFDVEDKTLKAGNIAELNKFFSLNNQLSDEIYQQFGFYIGEEIYGLDYNRKSSNSIIDFNLFEGDNLEYKFCLDQAFFKGKNLFFSGCLSNKNEDNKSALYLGLSDIVDYGNNTDVKISLLPACYDMNSNEFITGSSTLMFNYDTPKLAFEYTGEYINEELLNNLELTYKCSSKLGLRALWKQNVDGEDKKLIGIVFYNN